MTINDQMISNFDVIKWMVYILYLPVFLYISSKIVTRIYERDYTFRQVHSITKSLKFTEILELGNRKKSEPFLRKMNFISKIEKEAREKFLLMDEERAEFIYVYLFTRYGLTSFVLLLGLFQNREMVIKALVVIPFILLTLEFYINTKIKQHEKTFENYSYKIFKFINNQRTAGTPTQKLISKLHLAVTNKKLKKRLISFAAEYIAYNDFDSAFNTHIMRYYSSGDARMLDSALRQGLNIGDLYTVSDNEEELMFEKYISYIDYETEKKKIQTVLVAAMYSVTLIGIVAYPLVLDVLDSFSVIFSNN